MTSTLITALSTLLNAFLLGRHLARGYETLSAQCGRCRDRAFIGGLRGAGDTRFGGSPNQQKVDSYESI